MYRLEGKNIVYSIKLVNVQINKRQAKRMINI